jgi:N-acetylglucosaminyldiphosphoundecaprenol N-acetyl-beta-D-mannosaminyltransferase
MKKPGQGKTPWRFSIKTPKENILGYRVDSLNLTACVDSITDWMKKGKDCRWLACLNPHSYVVSLNDPLFSKALRNADWLIPDGVGIVWASRILKGVIRQRVTGNDVFLELNARLNRKKGFKVFFLGSSEEILRAIRSRMERDFPGIRVVGTYSPPYKPEFTGSELDNMIKAVNRAKPDLLWVGMTAPKQEKFILQSRDKLKVKFAGAVGAVFDFYSGNVKQAHPFFQKLGFEWLFRLSKEPRRLWYRYLVNGPIFLWYLLKTRVSSKKISF